MRKIDKINLIRDLGLIAIMRVKSSEQLIAAADAIKQGGARVIEVTMTTPDAIDVIKGAKAKFSEEVLFGAGSVLDPETARLAILAGADFIVAPTLNFDVITLCHRYGTPIVPGCYSATEILTAWEAGADMIKLFPASVGGPNLVKALLAPLPQVEIIPVGGVNLETAAEFIRKGAAALGVGSSLIDPIILETGDLSELTRRAALFVEKDKGGRENRS